MAAMVRTVGLLMLALTSAVSSSAQSSAPSDARNSLVIVLRDGQQQSFLMADVARIELGDLATIVLKNGHRQSFAVADIASMQFNTSGMKSFPLGRSHFLGKWEVGVGDGGHFFIVLEPDGQARKSIGASHGTWAVVDGEARISWDDGWHDAIRKVGTKYEKFAYEPGKYFSDQPANVTDARITNPQPI